MTKAEKEHALLVNSRSRSQQLSLIHHRTYASAQTRLSFDKEDRGFTALAFSPCGKRLAAVATDNYHTVYVWDWRKKRKLSSSRGQMGDPPQVGPL